MGPRISSERGSRSRSRRELDSNDVVQATLPATSEHNATSPNRTDEPPHLTRQSVHPLSRHQGSYIRYWLSNRDDYNHYFLSQGGGGSRTANALWPAHSSPIQVDTLPVSSAASSCKADSVISNVATYGGENTTGAHDTSTSSFIERALHIKRRLETERRSANVDDLLRDVTEEFNNLVLDYSRYNPRECSPTSRKSSHSRNENWPQGHSSSQPTTPQGKRAGKQPVSNDVQRQDGEPSLHVQKRSLGTKNTCIRCFYHFGRDPQENFCDVTKLGIRDLIVHWISHGVHYCSECSQSFSGPGARETFNRHKSNHEENRLCIDIECVNFVISAISHPRRNRCINLHVRNIEKQRKYYSLFRLALPDVDWPDWDVIEINSDNSNDHEAPGVSEEYHSELPSPESMNLDSISPSLPPQDNYIPLFTSTYVGDGSVPYGGGQWHISPNTAPIDALQEELSELRVQTTQQRDQQRASEARIDELQATVDQQNAAIQFLTQRLEMFMNIATGTVNPGNLQHGPT